MSTKTKAPKVSAERESLTKDTKKFDITYAVVVTIAFAVIMLTIISTYYIKNYVMFSPEKVAQQYVQSEVSGDGYDALKYTILSKNDKLGEFMKDNYMGIDEDKKEEAPALTPEEEGEKLTLILDTMYPTFVNLAETYGFDDYDTVFSKYFAEYRVQHNAIYGHDIITTDDMFTAIEGNLKTYMENNRLQRETLYGKGEEYATRYLGAKKAVLGKDDEKYSAGYLIQTNAEVIKDLTDDEVKAYVASLSDSAKARYAAFGVDTATIKEVSVVKVTNSITGVGDKTAISDLNASFASKPTELTLIKIDSQWYVDFSA